MASIADDIEALLKSHGFKSVKVHYLFCHPLVHQLDDRRNKTEAENIWYCTSCSPSMQQLVCWGYAKSIAPDVVLLIYQRHIQFS